MAEASAPSDGPWPGGLRQVTATPRPQRRRGADDAGAPGVLVIGLGNPLRGDDGVGWWLAQRAGSLRPAPRVRMVQQLTPELSLELAEARRVLFIDAWLVPPQSQAMQRPPLPATGTSGEGAACGGPGAGSRQGPVGPAGPERPDPPGAAAVDGPGGALLMALQPGDAGHDTSGEVGPFSHRLTPVQLLTITALLHGRSPAAWLLLVPAFRCDHGEEFSAGLRRLLPQAQRRLHRWCAGEAGGAGASPCMS